MIELGAATEPQLDAARVMAVAGLLGREKLCEMLDLLAERLAALADQGASMPSVEAIRIIHQSQGSASSLGLHGLHLALQRLETMTAAGDHQAIAREMASVCGLFAAERALLEQC